MQGADEAGEVEQSSPVTDKSVAICRGVRSAMEKVFNPLRAFVSDSGKILEQGRNNLKSYIFVSGGGCNKWETLTFSKVSGAFGLCYIHDIS